MLQQNKIICSSRHRNNKPNDQKIDYNKESSVLFD